MAVACNEFNRSHIVGFIFFTVERKSNESEHVLESGFKEDRLEEILGRLSEFELRLESTQRSLLSLLDSVDRLLISFLRCKVG